MHKILFAELRLGLVQFDWTFIFQLFNSFLWILIIYAIYTYFKKSKKQGKELEDRIRKLEQKVDEMKDK